MSPTELALEALKLAQDAQHIVGQNTLPAEDILTRARAYLAFLTQTEAVVQIYSQVQQKVLSDAHDAAEAAAQAVATPPAPAPDPASVPPGPAPAP